MSLGLIQPLAAAAAARVPRESSPRVRETNTA